MAHDFLQPTEFCAKLQNFGRYYRIGSGVFFNFC